MPAAESPAPESRVRSFPCESCGADLEFRIGAQALACPYCGFHKSLAPEAQAQVVEQDLESTLVRLARQRQEGRGPEPEALEARCGACHATVRFQGTLTSQECVYCGAPVQRADVHRASERVGVDGVLPFAVPPERARQAVGRWLRSRWLAPGSFTSKRAPERLRGVYLPFWTFDALTFTSYRGRRGERRGKDAMRWSSRSGSFQRFFDDVAVVAEDSLPEALRSRLTRWPFGNCQPYRPDFLAGYLARTYDVPLEEGFKRARASMEAALERDVRNRIGGSQQRIEVCHTRFDALTYKHLLLPVWLLAVRHGERAYQVVVNGATGEVHGQRPWSPWKVGLSLLAAAAVVAGFLYIRG